MINWRHEFSPQHWVSNLVAGLVTGVNAVTVSVAYATLVFSGALSEYVLTGIGFTLFSSIALGLVAAWTSSFPCLVAGVQGITATVLALITAQIVQTMPATASGPAIFWTVTATIGLASVLTGSVFLLLGQFKLGNLVRYTPYPVICGFLAGTSILFVRGGLTTMIAPTALTDLLILAQPHLLARWLPGLVFAALLLLVSRRFRHFMVMPGMLAAAIALFYAAVWLTGHTVTAALEHGWLLSSPMLNASAGALWHPWDWAALQQIHWDVIGRQAGNLAAVVMVSVITILLRATGIELITAQNADLNHELRAAGLANLVAGLGGGMIGFHSLIDAVLAHKMKATRLVGVVLAGICSVALVAGGAFLSFFPRPVLGGLLLFLGLDLIIEWVYKPWFKLPKVDYAMVILILAAINLIGFLEGVGLGLALAMVVFIVNYSSLSVVKHTLSGATYTSNVDRPRLYHQLLRQKGHWLYILELQGFIFFGTAQRLLDQIRQRIHDPALSPPHFVVLDFRLVSGLDSSAVLSFAKMKQLAQAHHFTLVLTHLAPKMQPQVSELFADPPVCRAFPDLDHGLEWCEDQAIETFESVGLSAKPPTLLKQLEKGLPRTVNAALLLAYFERREFAPGACLICQGAESRELYFIEMGQVTVQRQLSSGAVRLRTLGAGTIVGELGLYLRQPASASVVADQLTVAYSLTAAQLQRMEHDAPELASAFHRFIVGLLSERVARMNSTVQALLD